MSKHRVRPSGHLSPAYTQQPVPDELPSRINKKIRLKAVDGKTWLEWKIVDEIRHHETNFRHKLHVAHLIEADDGSRQIRLGYYMVGAKPGARGRWVWGQYTPHYNPEDLGFLIREMKVRGWLDLQPHPSQPGDPSGRRAG